MVVRWGTGEIKSLKWCISNLWGWQVVSWPYRMLINTHRSSLSSGRNSGGRYFFSGRWMKPDMDRTLVTCFRWGRVAPSHPRCEGGQPCSLWLYLFSTSLCMCAYFGEYMLACLVYACIQNHVISPSSLCYSFPMSLRPSDNRVNKHTHHTISHSCLCLMMICIFPFYLLMVPSFLSSRNYLRE